MKRGSLLTFVLVVILAASILVSATLRVSSGYKRSIARQGAAISAVFSAESAILAYLEGFPSGYFENLPSLKLEKLGPWLQITAQKECAFACSESFGVGGESFGFVKVLAGKRQNRALRRFDDWREGAFAYRSELQKRMLNERGLKKFSGNKRFFSIVPQMVYVVDAGDCTLDLVGRSSIVSLHVDGNALLKGDFEADTLRVFAKGRIDVSGRVLARWVEIYSDESVRIAGKSKLRGFIWGSREVSLEENAVAYFPSVVLAMGSPLASVSLQGKSRLEGVLEAPGGHVNVENSAVWDSAWTILPFFLSGENVAFEQNISR